jgi:hypothetical protein
MTHCNFLITLIVTRSLLIYAYFLSTGLSVTLDSTINLKHPKLKPKTIVTATCDFDYIAEKITLQFTSTLVIRPKSVKLHFRKQTVTSLTFGSQSFQPNEVFTATTSFRKVPIDFFGFSADRIFTVVLDFESSQLPQLMQATFSITLPVVKQTELSFKAPGTTYPDAVTRRICTQAFKMNERNCDEEINRCIKLEEFKLMSAVERYKIYGYVDMLELFLDIENSFELDLLQKFSLNNVEVKRKNTIQYRIDVSRFLLIHEILAKFQWHFGQHNISSLHFLSFSHFRLPVK